MERELRNLSPGLSLWLSSTFSYSQGADSCVCMDLIISAFKISLVCILITARERKKVQQLLSQGHGDHCCLLSTFKCQTGLSVMAYPSHFEQTDRKARRDTKHVTFGCYPACHCYHIKQPESRMWSYPDRTARIGAMIWGWIVITVYAFQLQIWHFLFLSLSYCEL